MLILQDILVEDNIRSLMKLEDVMLGYPLWAQMDEI